MLVSINRPKCLILALLIIMLSILGELRAGGESESTTKGGFFANLWSSFKKVNNSINESGDRIVGNAMRDVTNDVTYVASYFNPNCPRAEEQEVYTEDCSDEIQK